MFPRLLERMRQKEYRRLIAWTLAGKVVGAIVLILTIKAIGAYVFHPAFADDTTAPAAAAAAAGAPPPPGPAYVNPINTMRAVIAAFLGFFLQAGVLGPGAGLARTREAVNVLLEGIVDTCLCGILFWAWGFAFMFSTGNGFIGHQWFFLQGVPDTYQSTGVAFLAYWLFQFAFADTCSTITSGAMVGRTGFVGDLLYSFGVSGFIYPIIGHWAWGPDGWLTTLSTPFRDFAGSTVVHTIGGFIAMAGAIALGPRLGRKFKRDGGGAMPGHDMTIAACAGGLSGLAFVYPRNKIWDCGMTVNGFLAGLVAITCPCYWVSPTGAII